MYFIVAAPLLLLCEPNYFKASWGISVRLTLQPDHSIKMSALKVKLAIIENMYLWLLCVWKERAGDVFLLRIHFYLYTACASSLSSRYRSLDQSPWLILDAFWRESGEKCWDSFSKLGWIRDSVEHTIPYLICKEILHSCHISLISYWVKKQQYLCRTCHNASIKNVHVSMPVVKYQSPCCIWCEICDMYNNRSVRIHFFKHLYCR